jgi:hypothetical protein
MDLGTLTRLRISIGLVENDLPIDHLVYEGAVDMSDKEIDAYKKLIGDGKSSVTASRDLSEMHFGSGGKVFVSVTLTVDQSMQGIETGIYWASDLVERKIWEAHAEMKKKLTERGILK